MRHGCLLVHANNAIFTALFITTEGLRWHYLHNQEQLWGTNIDDTRQKKIAGKKKRVRGGCISEDIPLQ